MAEGKYYEIEVTQTGTARVWANSRKEALEQARNEDINWGDTDWSHPMDIELLDAEIAYQDCDEECADCGYMDCERRKEEEEEEEEEEDTPTEQGIPEYLKEQLGL